MRTVRNRRNMLILGMIMFAVVAFAVSGCATSDMKDLPGMELAARGGTNDDGDFVWIRKANILLAGDIIHHDVWCKNVSRINQPEASSLKSIPIVMTPYKTNSFGQWKTLDGKIIIIKSELQYQSKNKYFVLTNPIFYSTDEATTIQLQTIKTNGEKFIIKLKNGEDLNKNEYLTLDGGIKPPSPE